MCPSLNPFSQFLGGHPPHLSHWRVCPFLNVSPPFSSVPCAYFFVLQTFFSPIMFHIDLSVFGVAHLQHTLVPGFSFFLYTVAPLPHIQPRIEGGHPILSSSRSITVFLTLAILACIHSPALRYFCPHAAIPRICFGIFSFFWGTNRTTSFPLLRIFRWGLIPYFRFHVRSIVSIWRRFPSLPPPLMLTVP